MVFLPEYPLKSWYYSAYKRSIWLAANIESKGHEVRVKGKGEGGGVR